MTVVVGTAGHIDHGKTTLLRALTGMDADRLPDEKRRGLTIDIGYARAAPDDGAVIDYVDVPGHDKLVGNMLVGAGEIDACLLVVAADDGPRAQTIEHLSLIDALRIDAGVVALSKIDRVDPDRVDEVRAELEALIADTTLAGSPIVAVSGETGDGIEALKSALATMRDDLDERKSEVREPASLAIDRVFAVRGFGAVVTGSARGEPIAQGAKLRLLPADDEVRVRGIQVHDRDVPAGPTGGRVALNISGVDHRDIVRGQVLADRTSPLTASSRALVTLERPLATTRVSRWPPRDGLESRLHIGTDQVAASIGRSGRDELALGDGRVIAMLRLERPTTMAAGQRLILRQPHPADLLAGGIVLDPDPTRGAARKRQQPDRLMKLDEAIVRGDAEARDAALVDLHGVVRRGDVIVIAPDLEATLAAAVIEAASEDRGSERAGMPLAELRDRLVTMIRRSVSLDREVAGRAIGTVIDMVVAAGDAVRDADTIRLPGAAPSEPDPTVVAAAARLVELLDTSSPPPLSAAVSESGCPADAARDLERDGRIVVVDDDLAWSRTAYDDLEATALALARQAPMTPAALRDATGTSRKYVMALLEDLSRRAVLTRTPDGHVPGPRA